MKFLLFLVLAAGGAYYVWKEDPFNPPTGVTRYGEVRIDAKGPFGDAQMVYYVAFDSSRQCSELTEEVEQEYAGCGKLVTCRLTKNQCSDSIPAQYLKMLDQKPGRTPYLHISDPKENVEAITLFWGFSDEVAGAICEQMKAWIDSETRRELLQ